MLHKSFKDELKLSSGQRLSGGPLALERHEGEQEPEAQLSPWLGEVEESWKFEPGGMWNE